MHRFFVNPEKIVNGEIKFPSEITHQVINVLRLSEGDLVEVLDNSGTVYQVEIRLEDEDKNLTGKIIQMKSRSSERALRLSLFFGMTSRDKVEWILQKGTEVGVTDFYPFISSRTLIQSNALAQKKVERWERIIREAAEQSQQVFLPRFHTILDYALSLETARKDSDLCMLAWEQFTRDQLTLSSILSGFNGDRIALLVGPEGGFSTEEVDLARNCGCQIISLGVSILRMETAAIIFPALVRYELGKL